jgi:hypothetical protein
MLDGHMTVKEYICYPGWAHNRFFVTGYRYMLLITITR